jgi:hypothetical protein
MRELQMLGIAQDIGTPLALGGLFAIILFLLIKQIIAKNIFPSLTKGMSSSIIKKIIDYLFILAIVSLLLGFTSYILPFFLSPTATVKLEKPSYNETEKFIVQQKRSIDILRPEFEIFKENQFSHDLVLEKAPKFAERLDVDNNEQISIQFKILKNGYAAYAYFMAATVDSNNTAKKQYADKAIMTGEKTLFFIRQALEMAKTGNKKDQMIASWIQENDERSRTLYIMTAVYAIKIRLNKNNEVLAKKAIKLWESIPTAYKKQYPPKRHDDLKWFLAKERAWNNLPSL